MFGPRSIPSPLPRGSSGRGMTRRRLRWGFWTAAVMAVLVALAWAHNVPTSPDADDADAVRRMLNEHEPSRWLNDVGQRTAGVWELQAITAVQDAVLARAPLDVGIPLGMSREPMALYRARHGLCYDRGRAIEKALALIGFNVRYVAVFQAPGWTFLESVLGMASKRRSHVLVEVETSRGWLVVDTNTSWVAVDVGGRTWSIADLRETAQSGAPFPTWKRGAATDILYEPWVAVAGLYSRHGGFYPPYTPLPDVAWGVFLRSALLP